MKIGVDYYPEHWEEGLWEQDAERMKEIGVNIVRMAEFAWSRLEPREGEYHFEWLDRAVSLFTDRGIEVFLCTPTCTPPLWMFEKYPEIIQVDKNEQRISIGIRGHRCMNSPVYRQFCEKIIRQMVSRYRDNPLVIGYQIDNELEANHCRCIVCQEQFTNWMKKRYQTVQAINTAYGNSVWSGEYSSFSQVKPPMGENIRWQNPSLTLDFNRYASDSTVDYVEFQRRIIHEWDPDAVITTNNWLCENMPDFYRMFENLDFVSYDNYPTTEIPKDSQKLYSHAFHLDLMRGIKQKNFWIMEQLSGSVGSWMPMQPTTRPGMLEGYSLQAVAHGADAVLHFRWRTAVSGAEMFWHGILDHSNVPGRRYREFTSLCQRMKQLQELDGSVMKNRVALLYGSDQEYGFKLQHQAEGMYYLEQLKSLHDGFTCIGAGVDIVDENADFSEYDIVMAPTLMIAKEEVVQRLYAFVEKGGKLVLTNRSGVKDSWNKCHMDSLPGVLAKLAGVRVKEYDPIGRKRQALRFVDEAWQHKWGSICQNVGTFQQDFDKKIYGTQWCDLLETDTAEVIAVYDEEFYCQTPVITRNQYQKGMVYYLGTILDREIYITLAKMLAEEIQMPYINNLPLGIEVTQRVKDNKCWTFLFNNTDCKQQFVPEGILMQQENREQQKKPFYENQAMIAFMKQCILEKPCWELEPFEMQIMIAQF